MSRSSSGRQSDNHPSLDRACSYVHRDLAARNVLLSETYDPKICDFGLGRETAEDSDYYKSNDGNMLIPIRWTDPSVLGTSKFSEYTDVRWSHLPLDRHVLSHCVQLPCGGVRVPMGLGSLSRMYQYCAAVRHMLSRYALPCSVCPCACAHGHGLPDIQQTRSDVSLQPACSAPRRSGPSALLRWRCLRAEPHRTAGGSTRS